MRHGVEYYAAQIAKQYQGVDARTLASMVKENQIKEITEKLKVSDGLGAWIKDFQDSDAPQFKDADSKKRRDMAIAAFTAAGGKLSEELKEGSETWEAGYKRRVVKTTKPEHKEKGYNWRIKGKDRPEISIKLYKEKPSFKEFTKQMKRVAGHEFGG